MDRQASTQAGTQAGRQEGRQEGRQAGSRQTDRQIRRQNTCAPVRVPAWDLNMHAVEKMYACMYVCLSVLPHAHA